MRDELKPMEPEATASADGAAFPLDGSLERDEDAPETHALLRTLRAPTPGEVRELDRRVVAALEAWPPAARETARRRTAIAAVAAILALILASLLVFF